MKAYQAVLLAMLLLPGLMGAKGTGAAGGDVGIAAPLAQEGRFGLAPATDCRDARETWAEGAIREMESRLAVARDRVLKPVECYRYSDDDSSFPFLGCGAADSGGASMRNLPEDGAGEYSTTNVQVKGVDEADFVKNDGTHIYVLAAGQLQIVDAWPPAEARVVGTLAMPGTPLEMFVAGDRAVVYTSLYDGGYETGSRNPCTYGYDCTVTGDGRPLQILVVDLSDRSRPRVAREITFPGSYLASRRIGDAVFTVVYTAAASLPSSHPDLDDLPTLPSELQGYGYRCKGDDLPFDRDEVVALFEELRQENVAKIRARAGDWALPVFTDTWLDAAGSTTVQGAMMGCDGLFVPREGGSQDLVSIVAFDLVRREDVRTVTVLSGPGVVYASASAMYLATGRQADRSWTWYPEMPDGQDEATAVHRFALDSASPAATYGGSGLVKGHVLNAFSLDEFEGSLRVATTTGRVPDAGVHSTVTVLRPGADGGLGIAGVIDQIAKGEDIRAVRFLGDVGFVVTFKKTDPLFSLDLADPAAPRIAGELKIPGFSTYLHRLDATHLLSVGYDADDEGSFAWFQGILLQVFDVSDLARPRLAHRATIGTRGTTSDAATNHLAFTWFAPRGVLAVPMVICEGGEGGTFGQDMTFDGLLLYRVDTDEGFDLLGGVPRPVGSGATQAGCSSWWSSPDSGVKRSLFMDDFVWAVSRDALRASPIETPASPVATVLLD